MLKSWMAAYRRWDDEMLAAIVMRDPSPEALTYTQRIVIKRLAKLSDIERFQLHTFCVKYRGWKLWWAILKIFALFVLAGLYLYLFLPHKGLGTNLLVAQLLGWSMVISLVGIWFNYRRVMSKFWLTRFSGVAGVGLGVIVGVAISAFVQGKDPWMVMKNQAPMIIHVMVIAGLAYALMIGVVAGWRNSSYEAIAAQLALDAERERHARQESESQLRMLRAQIEPHFLFNTLGAVQQLAEHGAPKAAELTENLIVFLRACMHEMRSEKIHLGEELEMTRAYLQVMKVRMGQRLRFEIDLPPALAHFPVPSMIVLSLAENAIKHGLEPAHAGGAIQISVIQDGACIRVRVQDNGKGLSDQPGNGIGLQNVRDRLRLMFGEQSGLSIEEVDSGGVRAELWFPLNGDNSDIG